MITEARIDEIETTNHLASRELTRELCQEVRRLREAIRVHRITRDDAALYRVTLDATDPRRDASYPRFEAQCDGQYRWLTRFEAAVWTAIGPEAFTLGRGAIDQFGAVPREITDLERRDIALTADEVRPDQVEAVSRERRR